MKKFIVSLSLIGLLSGGAAVATPVSGETQLNMFHSWLINSGNVPSGIDIVNLSQTLVIDSEVETEIDDPLAVESGTQAFQVGNPFSDPPLPVESLGTSTTTASSAPDLAMATYSYSIEMEDDPDPNVFDIVRRDIAQQGFSRVNMVTNPVESSALSSHLGERTFRFDNTSGQVISFNLTGLFNADLSARFNGANGIARTSGGFDLLFDIGLGTSVAYFPVAPYLTTILDSDPGTFVNEQYLTNSGGITGVSFGASVSVTGTGGQTQASYSGQSRYTFGITLDPNASLTMATSFRQLNSIIVDPAPMTSSVPLPAGLPLLLSGLVGLGLIMRRRGRACAI